MSKIEKLSTTLCMLSVVMLSAIVLSVVAPVEHVG
jgi:hypothetical protein